ncbi:hypothetical protein [Nocardia miyunensis]|uniref:hypothetical protein n=1 Tax=Nocardia miyunensis TaxID=282684 RepID=UPI000ADC5B12|nr:hypothetical protein [Nocardia miyunensis]
MTPTTLPALDKPHPGDDEEGIDRSAAALNAVTSKTVVARAHQADSPEGQTSRTGNTGSLKPPNPFEMTSK